MKECDVALARILIGNPARGMLLTGLRGVGKTVLLNVVRDHASDMNYQVDLLEAPEGSPLAPQIIPSLRQMLLRLSSKAKAKMSSSGPCVCCRVSNSALISGVRSSDSKWIQRLKQPTAVLLTEIYPNFLSALAKPPRPNPQA